MEEQLEFFKENGYLVVPEALTERELSVINQAIDRDLVENESMWRGEKNGRYQNVHILLAHPEFDITMRPPKLLPLMEAIMGSDLCAEEHSVMLRAPNPAGPTECSWHRDSTRPAAAPPYFTRYLSVVFYLTDVDDTTHTFSILPGTAQSPDLAPIESYDLETAVHITGPAGTAALFNASTFHAGNVRQTTVERRTIHIYCGYSTDRYLSNHTIFPRRLWQGKDSSTQQYYSRPNPITQLLLERF